MIADTKVMSRYALENVAARLRIPSPWQALCTDWDTALQTLSSQAVQFLQAAYITQSARDVFLTDDMIRALVAFAPRVAQDEALLTFFWYCRHTQDFYAGKPAATLNHFGKGKVIYLDALGDGDYYETVARWSASLAGINPLLETPAGVEVVERWQEEQRILFVLNHTVSTQSIQLGQQYTNLLDGMSYRDTALLDPHGVMVLQASN